jgi:hypothetical protein
MTIYAILDDNNRVVMWGNSQFADAQAYEIDDYDRFYNASFCYYLKDDKLIYDDTAKAKAEKQEKIFMQINELKQRLIQSDYQAIKFAEGWISDAEYSETLNQRQQWRNEINKLEKEYELIK